MSTQLEAKFNRLKLSERDFSEAHEYLDRRAQVSDVVVQRALIVAAIVAYSRPFKKSYGTEMQAETTLDFPQSCFEDQEDRALHDRVIQLRDQGVAHSDYDRKPTRRVHAQGRGFMTSSKPFDPLTEIHDVGRFQRIAWRLKNYCVDQMFMIDRRLKGESEQARISATGIVIADGTEEISITIKLDEFKS